jgi:hypothetical protein
MMHQTSSVSSSCSTSSSYNNKGLRHHYHHDYSDRQLMNGGDQLRQRIRPPLFLIFLIIISCTFGLTLGFSNQQHYVHPHQHRVSSGFQECAVFSRQPQHQQQSKSQHQQRRRRRLDSRSILSSSSSSSDATAEQQQPRTSVQQQQNLLQNKDDEHNNKNAVNSTTMTIRNSLGRLTALTRPANVPAIILLHLLGIKLALESAIKVTSASKSASSIALPSFGNLALRQPAMWLVLLCVILVSSTSMVVNDYYDAKLGRDDARCSTKNQARPLISVTNSSKDGATVTATTATTTTAIPLPLVRTYVSDLYAILLLLMPFLPGVATRLAVNCSVMITFLYTKHLKPKTWIKNIACAMIIAASPLTSGAAALNLLMVQQQQLHRCYMPRRFGNWSPCCFVESWHVK